MLIPVIELDLRLLRLHAEARVGWKLEAESVRVHRLQRRALSGESVAGASVTVRRCAVPTDGRLGVGEFDEQELAVASSRERHGALASDPGTVAGRENQTAEGRLPSHEMQPGASTFTQLEDDVLPDVEDGRVDENVGIHPQ